MCLLNGHSPLTYEMTILVHYVRIVFINAQEANL